MVEDKYPKELLCELYAPGRRLFEFVVALRNVPSALSKASAVLGGLRINILSGFHAALPTEKEAKWSFFADLTDKAKPEDVAEALNSLDVVTDVKFSEAQLPGLIVDELHFPLLVLDERAVVFSVDSLAAVFRHLREITGPGVATVLLHQMGHQSGETEAKRVQERFHLAGEEAFKVILAERVSKGWGVPRMEEYDAEKRRVTVTVTDLLECLPLKGTMTEPASHFFRGYLEGALGVLMQTRLQVREVECVAKGDKRCTFAATMLPT